MVIKKGIKSKTSTKKKSVIKVIAPKKSALKKNNPKKSKLLKKNSSAPILKSKAGVPKKSAKKKRFRGPFKKS